MNETDPSPVVVGGVKKNKAPSVGIGGINRSRSREIGANGFHKKCRSPGRNVRRSKSHYPGSGLLFSGAFPQMSNRGRVAAVMTADAQTMPKGAARSSFMG